MQPTLHRVCAFMVLSLLVVSSHGCLRQQRPATRSALWERLRPKPISVGPNGVFMDVISLERPFGDRDLNESLWATADEEQLDIATRRRLEENGIRVGVLGGQLPAVLKTLFSEEELGRMNGEHLRIQAGVPTQIQTTTAYEVWPQDSTPSDAKDKDNYLNVLPTLRVTPRIKSDVAIELVMLPEIQYGEPRRQFIVNHGMAGVKEWSIQVGQDSRVFEHLRLSLEVRAGQYAMLTCFTTDRESLGARFFTRDQRGELIQRVLLIHAEPSPEAIAARSGPPNSPN